MRLVASAFFVCVIAASAAGHGGGGYRHPVDVPPDSREPIDPPPPPEPPVDWETWWTAAGGGFAPAGAARDRTAARRAVVEQAAPPLREILRDEGRNWRVRVAAMNALARIGDESIVPFAKRIALADSESVRREFRESATLALGRLGRGDDATRAFLADVLRSGPRDESFVRAFAAVALGLAGDDPSHASAESLLETVARAEPDGNVKPACLLALGLLGSDSAAPRLADAAVSGRPPRESTDGLSAVERAYAVEALARVAGREDATRELLSKLVREHGVPVEVRRAAVCAIGRSTSPGDDRTRAEVRLLLDVVDDDAADEDVRRLALVALGRRGASAGGAEEAAEIAAAVLRLFGRLEDDAAPFAASALGMIVRAPTTHERVVTKIRRRMESDARDAVRGAFEAVLVVRRDDIDDDAPAIDRLVAVLRDAAASGDRLRAAASALGEIGDRDDVPALARAAADADYRPRVPAVEALASFR